MMRVLSVAVAAVAAVVAGRAAVLVPVDPAAAATTLTAPSGVKVTPGVGQMTVSWNPVNAAGVTYSVVSNPAGKTCSVSTTSCVVTSTASTSFSFTVSAAAPGFNTSPPSTATAPLNPRLVLVVAGQSNANGYESYATDPVTKINYMAPPYANGADSHDQITWLPWSELPGKGVSPAPLDSPQQIGSGSSLLTIFGPELGLARQLWADTGRTVTIVKGAYTATSLHLNWSPKKTGTPPNGLYGALVARVKAVMATDAAAGQFDVLGGIYWYQGESDATTPGWARKYQTHLTSFVDALRADLPISPTAPVVLAEEDITRYIDYVASTTHLSPKMYNSFIVGNAEVRAADVAVAASLPDVRVVDTVTLPRVAPESVHVSNVGQLTLGDQMAKVSETLLP